MNKRTLLLLLILITGPLLMFSREALNPSIADQALAFIENKGQIKDQYGNPREDIDFILESPEMTLYIGNGKMHYQFVHRESIWDYQPDSLHPQSFVTAGSPNPVKIFRLDVTLANSQATARVVTGEPLAVHRNYYLGKEDGENTFIQVNSYKKITYQEVYPNIDWVLYTEGNQLKYDFVVHPGGQVDDIHLAYEGASEMRLGEDGSLVIITPMGEIKENAPYSYEKESGESVSSRFILEDNQLGFDVSAYSGTLVIDPAVQWSTYYGGSSTAGMGITADREGFIYISGFTTSVDNIATTGSHQLNYAGGFQDLFLAKFDSLGVLYWATYFGGGASGSHPFSGLDMYAYVTCDDFGHVYLYGSTWSDNGIATPGSFQDSINPATITSFNGSGRNAFLAQFNREGIRQWGTYYGANFSGFMAGGCDKYGNIYVGGYTDSFGSAASTLVTSGTHQTAFGGGGIGLGTDGIIVKFDSNGSRLWATYYGGEENDRISTMVCDDSSNVYLGGTTYSTTGLATPGAFQSNLTYGNTGFVAKFDGNTGNREWGTYIDGQVHSIAWNSLNQLYIAGGVDRASIITVQDIATPGSYMPERVGGSFLMRLTAHSGLRSWGTYYGGHDDADNSDSYVATDGSGNVYLAGHTRSYGSSLTYTISTPESHQDTLNTTVSSNPPADAYLVQFDSTGKRKWATYFGGVEAEAASGIACDVSGAIYILGTTQSPEHIATSNSYQSIRIGSNQNAFIARFLPIDISLEDVLSPQNDTVCGGEIPLEVVVMNKGRMDKNDTLRIGYKYTGQANGGEDTVITNGLMVNESDTFNLNLNLTSPGRYQLKVYLHYTRDDNERENDTITIDLFVTNAAPVAHIQVSQVGTTYRFSNPLGQPSDTYYWDFGDGNTSDEANPSHNYSETDSYLVTLIVTGFCGSDTATMMIKGIGEGNGIGDVDLNPKLSVYPNPVDEVLFVEVEPDLHAETYRVVSVLGKEIMHGWLEQFNRLEIKSLSAGTYILQVRTKMGIISRRFQVLKK